MLCLSHRLIPSVVHVVAQSYPLLFMLCLSHTRCCSCCVSVIPAVVHVVSQSYPLLFMLCLSHTLCCSCCVSVIPTVVHVVSQSYPLLFMLCFSYTLCCPCCISVIASVIHVVSQSYPLFMLCLGGGVSYSVLFFVVHFVSYPLLFIVCLSHIFCCMWYDIVIRFT